jgi:hypothetical protein
MKPCRVGDRLRDYSPAEQRETFTHCDRCGIELLGREVWQWLDGPQNVCPICARELGIDNGKRGEGQCSR